MASRRTKEFLRLYERLDKTTQALVDAAYENYQRDPSLVNFEQKGRLKGVAHYGARLNDNWRALAFPWARTSSGTGWASTRTTIES